MSWLLHGAHHALPPDRHPPLGGFLQPDRRLPDPIQRATSSRPACFLFGANQRLLLPPPAGARRLCWPPPPSRATHPQHLCLIPLGLASPSSTLIDAVVQPAAPTRRQRKRG